MEQDFKAKATNPTQYDSSELDWSTETADSPKRKFFYSYLEKYLGDLYGKRIIDIGSGTGYLTQLYKQLGAKEIFGVEPAKSNVEVSRKLNPDMKVTLSSFEDFDPKIKFDVAVSVMVFEHIADPEQAFNKVSQILESDGVMFLIIGDIDYYRISEGVEIEEISNGEISVKIERPGQIIYDIARPISNYIKSAEGVGFKFVNDVPMPPTEDLIKSVNRYEKFKDIPLVHLLIFSK